MIGSGQQAAAAGAAPLPAPEVIEAWVEQLQRDGSAMSDEARINMIRSLQRLKCAAGGAQATLTAEFDESQRA